MLGLDDPFEIIEKLRSISQEPYMQRWSEAVAERMVTHLFHESSRGWKEAAKRSRKGRIIYNELRKELQGPLGNLVNAQILRNAEYIQSVPTDIARQMTEHVLSKSISGLRYTDIAKDLLDLYPHISTVKASLIARTETAKTVTALTQGRCELMNVQWYRWRTSKDARVRDSHRIMDGMLIPWVEPPSPEKLDHEKDYGNYHAGMTWNCRCYAEPVIDVNFIDWPCKVYLNGTIHKMTKAQFEKLIEYESKTAASM